MAMPAMAPPFNTAPECSAADEAELELVLEDVLDDIVVLVLEEEEEGDPVELDALLGCRLR